MQTLAFTVLLTPVVSFAADHQWNFKFENDIWVKSDGNYTNGLSIARLSNSASSLLFQQQLLFVNSDSMQSNFGIGLRQRMWTPSNIEESAPIPDDRPYAGLLEFETYHALFNETFAIKNWLSLGTTGKNSGAEWTQKKVHQLTNSETPNGWHNQISNKMTFQYSMEAEQLITRSHLSPNSSWELSSFAYGTIGNFRTQPNVGLSIRVGSNLGKTFGQLSSHAGHAGWLIENTDRFNWFAYSRFQLGYRFNDLSIEGKLPYVSNVTIENKQAQTDFGLVLNYSNLATVLGFHTYTQEYETDRKKWHHYGSINFIWKL